MGQAGGGWRHGGRGGGGGTCAQGPSVPNLSKDVPGRGLRFLQSLEEVAPPRLCPQQGHSQWHQSPESMRAKVWERKRHNDILKGSLSY